jgi:hypothetical protein
MDTWDDPNRPLPVVPDKSKDEIIADLHSQIHNNNNKAMKTQANLEIQNIKLKKALLAVINFEWNAWTEAKKLLEELES